MTKSKRSLHWCRSISKNICAGFITVSVKKLLHYRAGGLLQYRAFYYIIGQLLHYRAFLLHYRAVITVSGIYYIIGWYKGHWSCCKSAVTLIPGPRRYSLHTNLAALRWTPSSLLMSPTWCGSQIAQQYSNLERTRA